MKDYFGEQGLPPPAAPVCPIVRSLAGQKALVTGANSGIGREIAIALGHAGADVVVNYVSREEEAFKTVEEVRRCGSKAIAFRADVSKEDEVQRCGARAIAVRADVSKEDEVVAMFRKMRDEFGTIDILVNNAGLQKDAPFDELTVEQWDLVMNVNLKGQFLCSREAVREHKN